MSDPKPNPSRSHGVAVTIRPATREANLRVYVAQLRDGLPADRITELRTVMKVLGLTTADVRDDLAAYRICQRRRRHSGSSHTSAAMHDRRPRLRSELRRIVGLAAIEAVGVARGTLATARAGRRPAKRASH